MTTNKIIVRYEGSVYAEAKVRESGSSVTRNTRGRYGGYGVSFILTAFVLSIFPVSTGFTRTLPISSLATDQTSPVKRAANKAKDSSSGNGVAESGRELTTNKAIVKLKSEISTLINELERDFPESNEPKVLQGKMYRQLGDYARAVKIWEEILKENPRNAELLSNLGMVALEMEEYEKAVMYWRQALVINPRMPGLHQDTGFALLEAGRYREAIRELQEELKFSPQSRMSLNLLGQCYLQLKEYQKAMETYEKVIEIDPKDATAYYGLITVYTRLKQPDKAKEYTGRFKELRQDGTHLIRGGYSQRYDLTQMRSGAVTLILDASALYRSHGNVKKADSLLEWARKLGPEKVISYMKGQVIYHQMRLEHPQALALIKKVAELEPDNADNWLAVGILSVKASKPDKAEAAFKRTIELAPQLPDGYRELARLYTMLNIKRRETLKLAERAVELEGSAEDYYILSCAYINNNQKSSALSAMQKAVELEPEDPFYRQVYDYLKKKTTR